MRVWLTGMAMAFAGAVFAADFVPGVAAADAGGLVAPGTSKFFVFFIPAGTAPETVMLDIKKSLGEAATTKASLGIIGPDYSLNAKILGEALRSAPQGLLSGASILLVNGGEDVGDLKALSANAGAILRATKYSGK